MNYKLALFAYYEKPFVPLTDISEEFLGLAPKTAIMRARAGTLPLPAFRADKGKSPFMVDITDLADFFERKIKEAREEFQSVQA